MPQTTDDQRDAALDALLPELEQLLANPDVLTLSTIHNLLWLLGYRYTPAGRWERTP